MVSDLYEYITERIFGRIAMNLEDAKILINHVERAGAGDYLEIGALYGGSLILVGLARKELGLEGLLYAIDPMNGYYGRKEGSTRPCAEYLFYNAELFGLKDSVRLIKAKSHPWPLPEDVNPVITLIDGDHRIRAASHDGHNALRVTGKFALFHDYNDPNVARAASAAIAANKDWRLANIYDRFAAIERIH